MLKITVEPEGKEVRLKLEGDLAGAWVRDLEECWRMTVSSVGGRAVCVDLTGARRVDDAGRYLLALIHEAGARLVCRGVVMTELLDSFARDWPPMRIEGPGWAAIRAPRLSRR